MTVGPHLADDVMIRERARRTMKQFAISTMQPSEELHELQLVKDLRAVGLAMIELVAIEHSVITGHILFSQLAVAVGGRQIRALPLAPMSVQPDRQHHGIGGRLVRRGLDLARERRWQAVIVLGHPGCYPRFGFSAALAQPLASPFSGARRSWRWS